MESPTGPWITIVGEVHGVRYAGPGGDQRPTIYYNFAQSPRASMTLVAHTTGDPAGVVSAVRREILALDADQPVDNVGTMEQILDSQFKGRRLNTMLLGVLGASVTMVLGGIVAYITTRTTWRGRRLIDILAWLPWMMPGMVLGIGFLWGFATLPHAIPIYGTLWALLLAYVALGTPVAVRVTSGAFAQIARDIEECSRVHGANWWQTMGRILVALAWPAFAVGWVLIFFGIMRELSASILLYVPDTTVLSVVMLKLWNSGKPETVSVIGLVMLVLVLLFRWVQLRFIKRRISTL